MAYYRMGIILVFKGNRAFCKCKRGCPMNVDVTDHKKVWN